MFFEIEVDFSTIPIGISNVGDVRGAIIPKTCFYLIGIIHFLPPLSDIRHFCAVQQNWKYCGHVGYKTYWREPGDSGLPPVFDWQGSENVATVDVRWPVPVRFADGSGSSIGYKDSVILPVLVTLRDTGQPARLKLKIDYGICAELCVPALGEGDLTLLPDTVVTPHRERVEAALGTVPQSARLGDGVLPGVVGIEPDANNTALRVKVARLAGAGDPDLFVEGPKGWYFGQPVLSGATDGTELDWLVPLEQKPDAGSLAGLTLRLTAVAGSKATETSIRLDEQGRAR